MTNMVRDINQRFLRSRTMPHLTIRTTSNSLQGYKEHSHSELSIGIIESGSTCLSLAEGQVILNQGDMVLIESDKVHSCNPIDGQPRSYHMLYVDKAWCCQVLSAFYGYRVTEFSCNQHVFPAHGNNKPLSGFVGALFEQESPELAEQINSYLFDLLTHYCLPYYGSEEGNDLANQVRAYLLEDIVQPPSLTVIADRLGRPKESLIRNFKSRFGITPKAFLNNSRVEKAKFLLKCGMDIVDVAAEVGFSDQSQLHRSFVNYTASTPGQYQQVTSIFDNKS